MANSNQQNSNSGKPDSNQQNSNSGKPNSKQQKWSKETMRLIWELDKAIEVPSNQQNIKNPYILPYEQVWEYSPAQGLDERYSYPLQVAGTEFAIQLQISLGKFLHDLLGRRLGYLVRFEDFWEQWSEKSFEWVLNRTGTPQMQTNYPFRDVTVGDREIPGWRSDRKTRPAYLEWLNPNKKANPYYRIIEYWPNKSEIETSFVLIGSDSQIIQHIVAIEYSGAACSKDPGKHSRTSLNRGDFPLIELWFREVTDNFAFGKQEYRWRLRLIGKTFTNEPNIQKWVKSSPLTEAEIVQISQRIIRVFKVDARSLEERFIFKRGKKLFVYKDKNGLFNKGYCLDESEAKKLITAFCEVMEVEPDWKCLDIKTNAEESQYSETPEKIKILDKEVNKPIRRPRNRVLFWEAVMSIPGFPTFPIANFHGFTFKKLPEPQDLLHSLQA